MEGCIARPAHCVEEGEDAADVIQMKMRDEDFIQLSGMHAQGEEIPDRTASYIEDEGITVPQLDEKTGCPLANAHRSGSPRAARRDTHLVLSESLFAWDVVLRVLLDGSAGRRRDYRSLRDRLSSEM